jgi:hypothetical protein
MGRPCSLHGRYEKCNKILHVKPEGKRSCRRPRCRWENNTRMNLQEIGWRECGLDLFGSR